MASPKELVAVISETMGLPTETVAVIDRFLAEAGLRTRARRGRGNTPMTYMDAAHLIIASALGVAPKDAVSTVRTYAELPSVPGLEQNTNHRFLGDTFGTALAELVETVAKERTDFSAGYDKPNHKAADVFIFAPSARATVKIMLGNTLHTFHFGSDREQEYDLKRTVQFSQITLGFVGEVIAGK